MTRFASSPVVGLAIAALSLRADNCAEIVDGAQRAFQSRRLELAAAEFQRALSTCSRRPDILVALGQVLYLSGKEMEAEDSIKSALSIDANNVAALYALGRIYSQQNRFPEAAEKLRKVVELDPKNYRAWDNLGVCFDAMNQDSEALRSFFKALDLVMNEHPDYDWAHANLADFFLRRNEFEKAFQLAAEATQRDPNSARNFFLTGKALVKLEKQELSLRWLERAVELDPSYSEAWYLLAQTYRKLERKQDSDRALARFRELSKQPRPHR